MHRKHNTDNNIIVENYIEDKLNKYKSFIGTCKIKCVFIQIGTMPAVENNFYLNLLNDVGIMCSHFLIDESVPQIQIEKIVKYFCSKNDINGVAIIGMSDKVNIEHMKKYIPKEKNVFDFNINKIESSQEFSYEDIQKIKTITIIKNLIASKIKSEE